MTLLEDLEDAAKYVLDAAQDEDENAAAWQEESRGGSIRVFAARLREHAEHFKEELERAQEQRRTTADFGEVESSLCLDMLCRVLERINNGEHRRIQ